MRHVTFFSSPPSSLPRQHTYRGFPGFHTANDVFYIPIVATNQPRCECDIFFFLPSLMSVAPRQDHPSAQSPADCEWPWQQVMARLRTNLCPGWQLVSPGKWTCTICLDGTNHPIHRLNRHLNSARHRQSVEYTSSQWTLSLSTDDAGHQSGLADPSPDEPFDISEVALDAFTEVRTNIS